MTPTLRGTRVLLTVFTVATLLAVSQLYFFSADTDRFFAWTIDPPLSAAFMGAGFGAGFVLVVLVRRAGHWAEVRLSFLAVLVFALVTLAATVIHIDRFHFGAGGTAEFAAWLWLAVYIAVPAWMVVLLVLQSRAGRAEPETVRPMPAWLTGLMAVEGVVTIAAGVALFLAPGSFGSWWPWPVTPLVARAFAGWLAGLGLAALLAIRERDLSRMRAPATAWVVFAVLVALALLRFGDVVRWADPAAWVFVAWLTSLGLIGAYGLLRPSGNRSS